MSVVADALRTHRGALRRFVASRADAGDIDDVLQMAALRALERADTLQDQDRVLGWLLRIHANTVTDLGRASSRNQKLLDAWAADAQPVRDQDPELCRCSLSHAKKLSKNYASIIDLVDIAVLPISLAAAKLNISINNATVRLHRARAALKARLQEHCGVTASRGCNDCQCSLDGY